MRIAIIGAGIAGLACASGLQGSGFDVVVFDKGRGVGGRMSVKRLETPLGVVAVDHGAQFFTARDAEFQAALAGDVLAGSVAAWPAAGMGALVGAPGMNAPLKRLAATTRVELQSEVLALRRTREGWRVQIADHEAGPFDVVVVTAPAEQSARLLTAEAPVFAAAAAATPTAPCLVAIAVMDRPLEGLAEVLRPDGALSFVARNRCKPQRQGPEAIVLHGSVAYSQARLEASPEAIAGELWAAFQDLAGAAPDPIALIGHRWRYARSGAYGTPYLWSADLGLGVCGDWLLGPRVESGWLSGRALALLLAETYVGLRPKAP